MNEMFLLDQKYLVVNAVLVIILVGIFLFLIHLSRKISNIEKQISKK